MSAATALKNILPLFGYVFLAWLIVVGVMYVLQRGMMYLPDTRHFGPAEFYGIEGMREVTIVTEDGLELGAFFMPPPDENAATLVLFHGNAGHIGHRVLKAATFHMFGMGVLLVEYRGYGGNPGSPTEDGLYMDGRAAMDFLIRRENIAPEKIVLYGESLGSGIAVQMATEFPAAAMVLETPFTSTGNLAAEIYPFIPARLLVKDRYDNIKKISKIKEMPLLILHGTEDGVVPFRHGEKMFAAANDPKEFAAVEGANHNNLFDFPETAQKLFGFLQRYGLAQSPLNMPGFRR